MKTVTLPICEECNAAITAPEDTYIVKGAIFQGSEPIEGNALIGGTKDDGPECERAYHKRCLAKVFKWSLSQVRGNPA